jgi:hypothetical protein
MPGALHGAVQRSFQAGPGIGFLVGLANGPENQEINGTR